MAFNIFATATSDIPLANLDANFTMIGSSAVASTLYPTASTSITYGTAGTSHIFSGSIGAFTLGGTVAGGGNQLNNVIIGASSPLAGAFTTVTASTAIGTASGGTGLGGATPFTSGGVVYASSSSVLATGSALYFSGTNLGIGTNSPQSLLALRTGGTSQVNGGLGLTISHDSNVIANGADLVFGGVTIQRDKSSALADGDSLGGINWGKLIAGELRNSVAAIGALQSGTGESASLTFYTAPSGRAPVERARIDSSGNLGLGVTPSAWYTGYKAFQLTGDIGFASIGGALRFNNYLNAGASADIYYSNGWAGRYRFTLGNHLWDTAPSGTGGDPFSFGDPKMTLDASGNLLVGTTSSVTGTPRAQFVAPSSAAGLVVQNQTYSNDCIVAWNTATANNNSFIGFYTEGTISSRGSISYNRAGGLTVYNTTSDYRLKEHIINLPNALETVSRLKPRQFDWKETGNTTTGFIAHELAEVCPHAVTGEKDAVEMQQYEISPAVPATFDEEGKELTAAVEAVMGEREVPRYQGIDTSFLVATLTAAIQEQQAIITALTTRITALEAK